jgi:hypothetical protein
VTVPFDRSRASVEPSSVELALAFYRLEKRSQALQECNLTRNIQADGAPMVHRLSVGNRRGSCLTIGHRSYALENSPSPSNHHVPYCGSRPCLRLSHQLQVTGNQKVAQAPIGDSPKRSMKIVERSLKMLSQRSGGFIHGMGTPVNRGQCFTLELSRLRLA